MIISLIKKSLNESISLLKEGFDSQNRRSWQRRWDEIRSEMMANGFDPSHIVDDHKPTTAAVNKALRDYDKYLKEKAEEVARNASASELADLNDELISKLEGKGYTVPQIEQMIEDEIPPGPAIDREKKMYVMLSRLLDPVQFDQDEWESSGKENFEKEYPEGLEGELEVYGGDNSDIESDSENKQSSVRRVAHIVKTIMNKVDLSNSEMKALMYKLDIDPYIIDRIFMSTNFDRAALARASAKLQGLSSSQKADLSSAISDIMNYGTYRPEEGDIKYESYELGEDIMILENGNIEIIKAGSIIKVVI